MTWVGQVAIPVRCLNCGGSDSVALIGVIIAAIALAVSFIALYIALREHRQSVTEHAEFMKQLRARARFELTAQVLNGPAHDIVQIVDTGSFDITPATRFGVRIEIRLENVGEKAAGLTTLEVLAPWNLPGFHWINHQGAEIGSPPVE